MEQKIIVESKVISKFNQFLTSDQAIYHSDQFGKIEADIKKLIRRKLILKSSKSLIDILGVTNSINEIMRRRDFFSNQISDLVLDYLKKTKDSQKNNLNLNPNFILAVEDDELYKQLRAKHPNLYVYLLTDRNGLEEIKLSDQCRYIVTSDSKFRFQLENFDNVIICEERLDSYFPEKIIEDILINSQKIMNMILAVNSFTNQINYLKYLNLFDFEFSQSFNLNDLKKDFMNKIKEVNLALKQEVSTMNLTGEVLIKMQQGFNLHEIDEFASIIENYLENLISDLEGNNLHRLITIDNFEFQINDEEFDDYLKQVMNGVQEKSYFQYKQFASQFIDYRKELNELNQMVMILDVIQAVQSFESSYDSIYAKITDKNYFNFELAVNLSVKGAIPISYHTNDTDSILLTGANSGGKTSLLNLISQQFILTMLGLRVPAKTCELFLPDQMHYFVKENGQLNSGAFEQLLNKFASIDQRANKLILADEVESVTQPSAACKIINGLTNWFENSLSIFVTHLGDELSKVNTKSRIDGIVATGVENNEIIVERNPRINYLATSTPKLIVEKLNGTSSNEFYSHLLAQFD